MKPVELMLSPLPGNDGSAWFFLSVDCTIHSFIWKLKCNKITNHLSCGV